MQEVDHYMKQPQLPASVMSWNYTRFNRLPRCPHGLGWQETYSPSLGVLLVWNGYFQLRLDRTRERMELLRKLEEAEKMHEMQVLAKAQS
ncbi:hypothetical protein BT69DRAFT_1281351 [Atractiella rhizophila]|nr:hypothetical protein BT69DRAFT_1281351 [Atractiella rhizophila]